MLFTVWLSVPLVRIGSPQTDMPIFAADDLPAPLSVPHAEIIRLLWSVNEIKGAAKAVRIIDVSSGRLRSRVLFAAFIHSARSPLGWYMREMFGSVAPQGRSVPSSIRIVPPNTNPRRLPSIAYHPNGVEVWAAAILRSRPIMLKKNSFK